MLPARRAVADSVPIEQAKNRRLVQTGAVGPPDLTRVGHDDRPAHGRPNDRAETVAFAIVEHRSDRQRELSGLSAELIVAPARIGREPRNPDPAQQFPWRQRILERAGDELFHRKPPRAMRACNHAFRAERAERRDPVRRRVGMADAATDRAAVAHGAVGDAASHEREGLQVRGPADGHPRYSPS